MTDLDALLAAVLRRPDDDTVRLVYADALEDAGQADRARLIRMQVRRDRYAPPRVSVRKWFTPWWRGPSSYSFHNPQWDLIAYQRRPAPPGTAGPSSPGCMYVRRGFVDEAKVSAADWLRHADAILAAHPVRAVTWTAMTPDDRIELVRRAADAGRGVAAGCLFADLAAAVWPGITFTLPPPLRHAVAWSGDYGAARRAILDDVARSFGLPADLAGEPGNYGRGDARTAPDIQ